jgi:hypothetical protein
MRVLMSHYPNYKDTLDLHQAIKTQVLTFLKCTRIKSKVITIHKKKRLKKGLI